MELETFLAVLELIGTVAFAVSGAMTGLQKQMDLLGVAILGLTTAVGGGIIRDLVLGITPPYAFRDPTNALISLAASLLIFLPFVGRFLTRRKAVFDRVLLIMDSLGLAVFTVMGIYIACRSCPGCNGFLLVFVGVVTGVGGGVMRDVLAGNTPYIFVKHIYACASLAGALACVLLWQPLGSGAAMLLGMLLVLLIRFLSAHFKWNLPRARGFGA